MGSIDETIYWYSNIKTVSYRMAPLIMVHSNTFGGFKASRIGRENRPPALELASPERVV
jgi:hypothetical protein